MSAPFFKAVQDRRSVYAITSDSPISDEKIREVVEEAVKWAPSSFNMQSGRVVVVTGDMNQKVWDTILSTNLKLAGGDGEFPRQ